MIQKVSPFVAAVLLVCAQTSADVGQLQKHFLSSIQEVAKSGGPGTVGNTTTGWFYQPQFTRDAANGGILTQDERGDLMQSGRAFGHGGESAVVQEAGTWGAQEQSDNGTTTIQDQVADVEAFHEALADYGVGSGGAAAFQNVGAAQGQRSLSPARITTQDQMLRLAPRTALFAGPDSLAMSKNDTYVVGDQSHVVK
jgi:hypothetical protein